MIDLKKPLISSLASSNDVDMRNGLNCGMSSVHGRGLSVRLMIDMPCLTGKVMISNESESSLLINQAVLCASWHLLGASHSSLGG